MLNAFSTGLPQTNISVQATEIAADIAVVEYLQTMMVFGIDPGFTYSQVSRCRKDIVLVFFNQRCTHTVLSLKSALPLISAPPLLFTDG